MSEPNLPTEPSFEQAMERLEEIVAGMEGERMPLDEMVGAYEEGMRLLKVCRQRIETARRRVEMIAVEGEGKAALTAFDASGSAAGPDEAAEEKTRQAGPRRRSAPKPEAAEEDSGGEIRLF
jgi:exodeoxyribonuclease VII small subunit